MIPIVRPRENRYWSLKNPKMIEIEGKCDLCLIVEYENHSNKSKTSLAYQIRYIFENRIFEIQQFFLDIFRLKTLYM